MFQLFGTRSRRVVTVTARKCEAWVRHVHRHHRVCVRPRRSLPRRHIARHNVVNHRMGGGGGRRIGTRRGKILEVNIVEIIHAGVHGPTQMLGRRQFFLWVCISVNLFMHFVSIFQDSPMNGLIDLPTNINEESKQMPFELHALQRNSRAGGTPRIPVTCGSGLGWIRTTVWL